MSKSTDAMSALKTRPRDIIKMIILLLATILILYLVVRQIAGFDELGGAIQAGRWEWSPLTGALLVGFLLLTGIRWRHIIQTMGYQLPFGRTMSVIMASCPLAVITPSRVSDFLRALGIRDIVPLAEGSGSVLVYKFVDVQSLCLLGIGGALWVGLYEWALWMTFALASGFAMLGLISKKRTFFLRLPLLNRFEDKLLKLFSAFGAMRERPWRYIGLSVLSIIAWSFGMLIFFSLTLVFDADVSVANIFALWPIAVFVGLLPVTLSGMGTRDSAFIALLGFTGGADFNEAAVLAATLTYAVTVLGIPAIVGIPFMFRFMHHLPKAHSTT